MQWWCICITYFSHQSAFWCWWHQRYSCRDTTSAASVAAARTISNLSLYRHWTTVLPNPAWQQHGPTSLQINSGGHTFDRTAAQVTAASRTHYHWMIWRVTNGSADESWGLGRRCKKLLQFLARQISNRENIYQSHQTGQGSTPHFPTSPHPVHIYQPSAFVVRHSLPFFQARQRK